MADLNLGEKRDFLETLFAQVRESDKSMNERLKWQEYLKTLYENGSFS